jgi:flagellar assembly factor FliW
VSRSGQATMEPSPWTEESIVSPTATAVELTFPDGLVGLPELVKHRLSPVPDSALFELASNDDPAIGFIAAAADHVKAGTTDRLREKGLIQDSEWVLAILAVHGEPPLITANLAGPIVVDLGSATARQLVLEDPEFPLQAPVTEQI